MKITDLPFEANLDGTETVPFVKAGQTKRANISTLVGAAFEKMEGMLQAVQDASGRWWVNYRDDGTTLIQKPADAQGNRLDLQIASGAARITALEVANLLLPPVARLRLKKGVYNSGGLAQQVMASDPITVATAIDGSSSYASPVVIAKNDPRIRLLGGKWLSGSGIPGGAAMYPQSTTDGDPTTISASTGVPSNRLGKGAIEFVLPAGQTQFEVVMLGQGDSGQFTIEIDGIATNTAGYALPTNTDGHTYYIPITLPASAADRRIRAIFGFRPFVGLRLPAGGTIKAYTPPNPINAVFIGDSITQGAASTTMAAAWVSQASYRLGIDNPINVGIGGSGYLNRNRKTSVTVNITSGSANVGVVSGTLAAGQILEGVGIPYGATVTTGATAGGTAIIALPATATTTNLAAKVATGYNFLDRLTPDVLQAVNGGPPDVLFIAGGINDFSVAPGGPYTAAQTGAQALTILQAARAASPDMPIFLVGPWSDYNNPTYSATSIAGRDALFAAAAQVPRVHTIDVSTVLNAGNVAAVFPGGGVNSPHPGDYGHALYGQFVANAAAAIIATY